MGTRVPEPEDRTLPSWRSNLIRKTAELRRHMRFPLQGPVRILWQDTSGRERVSNARLVDVSVAGLKLRLDEQIPVRSYLICNERNLGISGRGAVRYCNFSKGKYEIGVEFNGGTGWQEPASETACETAGESQSSTTNS